MKNEINAVLENMTATTPEPEDYTGEDGLLYCGKCRKPKEAYFAPDKAAIFGRDRHPAECDCQRAAREEREAAEKRRRHLDTVEELKRRGFTDPTMRDWTFENDNGRNPQARIARRYVEHWEDMRTDNIGCLFWGGVGTGKSYLAGCIANALMEKEIPVHMTNFALILNDLAASFEGRNEYIYRLCRYGQFRPCRVRLFQERHYHHRRRQNGAGTGSGSRCYTKTGDLTSCKEADLTLLPLYNQPCSVVQ